MKPRHIFCIVIAFLCRWLFQKKVNLERGWDGYFLLVKKKTLKKVIQTHRENNMFWECFARSLVVCLCLRKGQPYATLRSCNRKIQIATKQMIYRNAPVIQFNSLNHIIHWIHCRYNTLWSLSSWLNNKGKSAFVFCIQMVGWKGLQLKVHGNIMLTDTHTHGTFLLQAFRSCPMSLSPPLVSGTHLYSSSNIL